MTNDVVEKKSVFGSKVAMTNAEALAGMLSTSASNDPRGGAADGSDFCNFSGKRGKYEIGIEKKDMDPEELWLINVSAFEDGWQCWKGGQALATRLYGLGVTPITPDFTEHGPFIKDGDGWSQAKSLTAKSIDTGQQVYFKTNSVSGVSVFSSLQKEIVDRIRTGQPYWPVVKFDKEEFKAKGYTNHKPVITVDGWLSDDVVGLLPDLMDGDTQFSMVDLYANSLNTGASKNLNLGTVAIEKDAPIARETKEEPPVATRRRRSL